MVKKIYEILENVCDPEVPVLSILDLGIVRDVVFDATTQRWRIVITPTYSGCPAMDVIAFQIRVEMAAAGFQNIVIETILQPAWTTDWMSEAGKEKLRAYGIAPPQTRARLEKMLFDTPPPVPCPLCASENTEILSEFGSTSCKALHRCKDCLEPFDYFKCH
jgi:ring-1,2-phenylacetyl-CoA epoxidase subunit PaaD